MARSPHNFRWLLVISHDRDSALSVPPRGVGLEQIDLGSADCTLCLAGHFTGSWRTTSDDLPVRPN